MQHSNNLADRAARAVERARASSDDLARSAPTRRHRHRGRLTRLTACLLGVDPADVVVIDDPNRSYGGYPGFVITVHDGDNVYRFTPDLGEDSTLHLLRPCRRCGHEVTTAVITSLIDLGRVLDGTGEQSLSSDQFTDDPAHADDCPSLRT